MTILSLEAVGYKKLCPKKFEKAEALKRVVTKGGYEVIEGDEFIFAKPLERRKFISLEATLSKENYTKWQDIFSSLSFLYNPWFKPENETYVSDSVISRLLRSFLEDEMPESLYALRSLFFWSHKAQLEKVFQEAVPKFLEKYPNGRLHFIRVNENLEEMRAVLRVLTAVDAFGFGVFEDKRTEGEWPSQLLANIHPQSIEPITESIINSLFCCFFRFIYGTSVGRLGGYIAIQIDPPHPLEPPYQRSRWDFNRIQGMFQPESGIDIIEYLKAGKPHKHYQASFRRHIFQEAYSADEFERIFCWTIDRINDFWRVALDFCKHTTEDGFVDFLKQRKTFLTLERILLEINYIFTEMDPFVRKTLYFNLHDKIATISYPQADFSKRRRIFNRLFKPTHYDKILRTRLDVLPEPFDKTIASFGSSLLEGVIEACLKSIWAKHRVSTKGVLTREPVDLEKGWVSQKMQDHTGGRHVKEDFAANLLHEIRNSLHGYLLKGTGFEEFMLMHSGDIPDDLPDLV